MTASNAHQDTIATKVLLALWRKLDPVTKNSSVPLVRVLKMATLILTCLDCLYQDYVQRAIHAPQALLHRLHVQLEPSTHLLVKLCACHVLQDSFAMNKVCQMKLSH